MHKLALVPMNIHSIWKTPNVIKSGAALYQCIRIAYCSIKSRSLHETGLQLHVRVRNEKLFFSYFSPKIYAVGTQNNRLNETVLLSTENIC